MTDCNSCEKRTICRKTCKDVEKILSGLDHSLNSHYKVLFFDPEVLDSYPIMFSHIYEKKELFEDEEFELMKSSFLKCFKKLTSMQKFCLILYYGLFGNANMTQKQISTHLHVSQNTVSFHIRNGKSKLKILIKDIY